MNVLENVSDLRHEYLLVSLPTRLSYYFFRAPDLPKLIVSAVLLYNFSLTRRFTIQAMSLASRFKISVYLSWLQLL